MAIHKGRVTEGEHKGSHFLNEKTNSLAFYIGKTYRVYKKASHI